MANHKYSVSKTKEITTRPIAENSTIEADYHVCRVYNEYGKNIYNFYIPVLTDADNAWIRADVGYGENKGTKSAPRFDLGQYDSTAFKIKVEGRVQRKLTASKGVCLCDVHNVYYNYNDELVYTFYSIVEQSGDEDWIGADSGYGNNVGTTGAPDFIHSSVSGYSVEKTSKIVKRKPNPVTDEVEYYVWNIHPKNSQLIVYQVFIRVVNFDWFNTDSGYDNNLPPIDHPEQRNILNDVNICSSSLKQSNVRRVMTASGKGIGFYDETEYVYLQTGKKIYSVYTLTDGYDFSNRDIPSYGDASFDINGKSPEQDTRLTVKASQSETKRVVAQDGTGIGFYIKKDVYINRNNEYCTTYYTPVRVYSYGGTDTGTGTNKIGQDGIPNFFDSSAYDSSVFSVEPTQEIVTRTGDYQHWYKYNVKDKTSGQTIYNVFMPVVEYSWMNTDVGYGNNIATASIDFSQPLQGLNGIVFTTKQGKEVVKRVYGSDGSGSGYYNPVQVITKHDGKTVFTWYSQIAVFPWVGNQHSYGDGINQDVQPYVDGNYDKSLISVTTAEDVIRDMDETGIPKAVYTKHTITYIPAQDVIGSYYELKLAMPWHLAESGYGDNIGTKGSPDFILACPDVFTTTQEPNQVTRAITTGGEQKPYIRFAVTLKQFPAHCCYYYYIRVAGVESWYRKDIGYGSNVGSYGAPDFSQNLDKHAFYVKTGKQVYRKMTSNTGYGLYKTVDVYYILDDSIIYSYYDLVTGYDWAFKDVGYGSNDLDLTHIGDLSQYDIVGTDEIVKRSMTPELTGIGWYKVHVITLKADKTVLYHYYEPVRTYAFVGTEPTGKYVDEPWKTHAIIDSVTEQAYMGKLEGTRLEKTTVISTKSGGDYFTWNLIDSASNTVIHKFYIHVNDYPWMNTDEGFGTNLVQA